MRESVCFGEILKTKGTQVFHMKIGQRYKVVRDRQRIDVGNESNQPMSSNKDDIEWIAMQYIFGKSTSIDSTRPTILDVTESKVTEIMVPTTIGNHERFQGMLERHPPHEFLISLDPTTSTTSQECCRLSRIDLNIRNLRRLHAQETDTVEVADKSRMAQKRLNNLIKPAPAKKKPRK